MKDNTLSTDPGEMRTIAFSLPVPGRWSVRLEAPSGHRFCAVLTKPDGSCTVRDLCDVFATGSCCARAGVGVVRVTLGAHGVQFVDPDIRPELFDVSVTAPTWRELRKEAVEHGVSVTGCLDCPFSVPHSEGFMGQKACRFIPDVQIPRDIVGTLSGCPMLHGDAVTVVLQRGGS